MSDSQSADHFFCFRCNRDLAFSEVDSDFLCNYCHEGFIERVPGPVPNLQRPNVGPRIPTQGGQPPQIYPSLNILRPVYIHRVPNQGQTNSGENNPQTGSQGNNVPGASGPSRMPGPVPRAIRVSFHTGTPQGLMFTPRPPAPPQPSGAQPQPNGGFGAMFTNLLRPFMQPQRNPTPENVSSGQNEQQPGNQPSNSRNQQPGGNPPQNMDPLNMLFQTVTNIQRQQQHQQGDGQNVNRDQPEQSGGTGESQQQPTEATIPINLAQIFNTVFHYANPQTQQGDGQNADQNQAQQPGGGNQNQAQQPGAGNQNQGQQLGGGNQQYQQPPVGGFGPQNFAPILQLLQSMITINQPSADGQNQRQPDVGLNFLEDVFQIFGDAPEAQGDNTNQQGGPNPRPAGGINWMQLLQGLLPQGTEIRFQFNGVDVNNDPNVENLINQLFNGAMEQRVRGISEEDLRRLPMTKVSKTHVENEAQCVTCMETFQLDEDVAELACKHIFHKACLIPWLQTRRTCPVCRAQVDPGTWPSAPPEEAHPTNNSFADMDELD